MNLFLGIAGIVILLVGLALCVLYILNKNNDSYTVKFKNSIRKQGPIYVILGALVVIVACSFVIIPTGKVGAVYQFGVLQEEQGVINSGSMYWYIPFITKIEQVSVMQENSNEAVDKDARVWGESKNKPPED